MQIAGQTKILRKEKSENEIQNIDFIELTYKRVWIIVEKIYEVTAEKNQDQKMKCK